MQMVQLAEEEIESNLEINKDGSITLPQVNLNSYSQWLQSKKKKTLYPYCWYKIADESIDKSKILSMKWTNPLMLGSLPSVAIIIKDIGLFELVDSCYASKFQDSGKISDFSSSATNFCQIYQNYRFWTTTDGLLRVIVVTPPQLPTYNIEWADFVDKQAPDYWTMKMFGNKFGYFINDLKEDQEQSGNYLEAIYNNWKKGSKKEQPQGVIITSSSGLVYGYTGIHLYRCWQCRRVLLKPLQCSKCKSVAYCSEMCQRKHWSNHRQVCTKGGLFYPHKFVK